MVSYRPQYMLHKLNEQHIVTMCIIMIYFHISNGKLLLPVDVTQAEWTPYSLIDDIFIS